MNQTLGRSDLVCHRPDGLEVSGYLFFLPNRVCHRPDGLEDSVDMLWFFYKVCHRLDGLEVLVAFQLQI